MDDLPESPFEKVLSYLSLEDRLKARAVSRRWYSTINSFKVKSLCYSQRPRGFILGKSQWVSGAFAQNFISSPRFDLLVNTFSPTILSNLKHLRLCNLRFNAEDSGASTLIPTLNLFRQLEELELIWVTYSSAASGPAGEEIELSLPMLTSVHLKQVVGIDQLTLDAPKLKKVKLLECSPSLRLKLAHADSVEWLATTNSKQVEVKDLKNLKYLHSGPFSSIDPTLLSSLEKLKEVHPRNHIEIWGLFDQKQRYGRADLKIFLSGLLLNGPEDPAIDSVQHFNDIFAHLVENPSRLADEIPFSTTLSYKMLDGVAPGSEVKALRRFTDPDAILVDTSIPVQDIRRFLNFLKNALDRITFLKFANVQPQELFDRLPEHCAIQSLIIECPVPDFRFLFRLEHLLMFYYYDQINAEVIREAFEKLQFLSLIRFKYLNKEVLIELTSSNGWTVSVDGVKTSVADLNAAIQLVFDETRTPRPFDLNRELKFNTWLYNNIMNS